MTRYEYANIILKERIVGNHIYGLCSGCNRWIKLTGFWKGIHFCI